MADKLASQPPPTPAYLISYPAEHIVLITINRPKAMNSLGYASQWEADAFLDWFDDEPSLRVAIVTGAGDKAFCAGQDLIEQGKIREAAKRAAAARAQGKSDEGIMPPRQMILHPYSGFMGISRRVGKKPIIAAVNGHAHGGGFEICLGCDMIIASPNATFALPEASRGLYAAAGGLSKLVRITGLQVATEVALTGRRLSPEEAVKYNIANKVSKSHQSLVEEAVEMAKKIAALSPDAVIVSRFGLKMALEEGSVERTAQKTEELYGKGLREGENLRIGLDAFAKKKQPQWVPSKL